MQKFTFEVMDEGRPRTHALESAQVSASNWPAAMAKAARMAKKAVRRGPKRVTITLNRI